MARFQSVFDILQLLILCKSKVHYYTFHNKIYVYLSVIFWQVCSLVICERSGTVLRISDVTIPKNKKLATAVVLRQLFKIYISILWTTDTKCNPKVVRTAFKWSTTCLGGYIFLQSTVQFSLDNLDGLGISRTSEASKYIVVPWKQNYNNC
jgi:hypothetical protein